MLQIDARELSAFLHTHLYKEKNIQAVIIALVAHIIDIDLRYSRTFFVIARQLSYTHVVGAVADAFIFARHASSSRRYAEMRFHGESGDVMQRCGAASQMA